MRPTPAAAATSTPLVLGVLLVLSGPGLPSAEAFLPGAEVSFYLGERLVSSVFDLWKKDRKIHKDNTDVDSGHYNERTGLLGRGINGGFSCAACTILVSIAEQLTQVHNETAEAALERMCTYLPTSVRTPCDLLVEYLSPLVAKQIFQLTSPDTICYKLGICYVDKGKQMCHLFPLPTDQNDVKSWRQYDLVVPKKYRKYLGRRQRVPWICQIPGVAALCRALDDVYDKLTPGIDLDGDNFSAVETLRGSIWRGRDCNDLLSDVRPGRRAEASGDGDVHRDSNCNGITGRNESSGVPFEEELCGGSGQRGVIFIGDSVTAHFHAPPAWFRPAGLTEGIWTNASTVVSNESDWPDLGFATGFRDSPMPALIRGKTDSFYLRLRERNLCNHRDYQNLGRNGAESNDTLEYMRALARDKLRDHPAVVFYSLIGNDVCNEHADTLAHMTPADVFRNNTMKTLNFLEEHLPPGSHVILMGLIDGSILYDAMAHRYHPLGELNQDLKYTDVYRWFNCMEMGPCHGWMTTNATLRKKTTKHARRLTRVLKHVAATEKFDSFDIYFVENPFRKVIDDWLDQGGEVWELIEPVDSLHPTQAAQPLIAEALWSHVEREMPQVLGPKNHRNQLIRNLFGDQNGH